MLNFGIIGTGDIVTRFINGSRLCPHVRLAVVYSRSMSHAQEFAAKHGIDRCFDSLDDLAACSEIDAVYIASPTAFHAPQAIKMMSGGKHVLCEKPAASNSAEFSAALKCAKENGVVLLEAMRPMFSPGFLWIKENLYKLGTLHQASLKFCKYSSRFDNYKNGIIENAFNPALSNGSLMDIGVYPAAIMRALFGNPKKISAFADILPGSIDASGTFLADYGNFICSVIYSKVNDSETESEIQGENGSILYSPGSNPAKITVKYRDGRVETPDIQNEEHDLCYEISAFADMAAGRASAEKYNAMTLDVLKILDEARGQCGIVFPADKR